jgi:beta-glucanase (GH16 family)
MLVIEARKDKWKNPAYDPNAKSGSQQSREFADYTSARLTTRGNASWTYGRMEVRAKVPAGRGTHTSIWMVGTNMREVRWPACGEIDIMTHLGWQPGVIRALVQTTAYNYLKNTVKWAEITIGDASESFHVYAVEWEPDHMDFFVDNQKYFTFRNEGTGTDVWPYDKPQRLLLNLAIGDTWGGRIDDSIFPQRFYIDYVRVYQKPAAHSPNQPAPDSEKSERPR